MRQTEVEVKLCRLGGGSQVRTHNEVKANMDETQTVKAYNMGVPGLVAHRTIHNDKVWTVTHQGSGLSVGWYNIPTLKEARIVAKGLGRILSDWTGDFEAICKTLSIPNAPVKRLRNRLPLTWV